jgi:hypothetical protein
VTGGCGQLPLQGIHHRSAVGLTGRWCAIQPNEVAFSGQRNQTGVSILPSVPGNRCSSARRTLPFHESALAVQRMRSRIWSEQAIRSSCLVIDNLQMNCCRKTAILTRLVRRRRRPRYSKLGGRHVFLHIVASAGNPQPKERSRCRVTANHQQPEIAGTVIPLTRLLLGIAT